MIRALREEEAPAFVELRRASLLDAPLAFSASPDDDFVGTATAVREQLRRRPDWVILGAFRPDLVGAVGLMRNRRAKSMHRAYLWGMYVVPEQRRCGIATALLRAALDHARALPGVAWVHLGVSSTAPEALRLYERAGFQAWGREPDAVRHGGRSADHVHLALRLDASEGGNPS